MCLPGKAGAPPHLVYTHERPEGGACVVVKPWPGLTTTMLATFCPEVSSPLLLSVFRHFCGYHVWRAFVLLHCVPHALEVHACLALPLPVGCSLVYSTCTAQAVVSLVVCSWINTPNKAALRCMCDSLEAGSFTSRRCGAAHLGRCCVVVATAQDGLHCAVCVDSFCT